MSKKGRFSRATWVATSILACALVVSLFLPVSVSVYWHMRHGNTTYFHGSAIPIPWGWWPSNDDDELVIQKSIWTYDRSNPTMILVLNLNFNRAVNVDVFKEGLLRDLSKQGYVLRSDRDIHVGTDSCLEFNSKTQRRNIRISCWSWKAHLSLDLFGRDSDIQSFYSVVSRVKSL